MIAVQQIQVLHLCNGACDESHIAPEAPSKSVWFHPQLVQAL